MTRRRVSIGSEGYGASLDVITLNGMDGCGCGLSGSQRKRKGIWGGVYGRRGVAWPAPDEKCVSWKPVGKGCRCKPECAAPGKGVSEKEATRRCDRRCAGKKRKKR